MNIQSIDFIDNLPLLTEVIGDSISDDLPILTEIVTKKALVTENYSAVECQPVVVQGSGVLAPPPHTMSEEEMQQLLRHLETHLETVFTSKLNTQLEQLQKLAVDLAVSEFKAELPKLLRDALKKTGESSK